MLLDIRERIIEEQFFEERGIVSEMKEEMMRIEDKQTCLVLDDRYDFDIDNMDYSKEGEEYEDDYGVMSTMGDYKIIIPIKTILAIKEDAKSMALVQKELGYHLRGMVFDEVNVTIDCNTGELAPIDKIRHIYSYKNFIEKKVKVIMDKANITDFRLEIAIITMY